MCFTTLGAEPFARLAEADLARVQPARVGGALTETESKIAELVATGLTNREVPRSCSPVCARWRAI